MIQFFFLRDLRSYLLGDVPLDDVDPAMVRMSVYISYSKNLTSELILLFFICSMGDFVDDKMPTTCCRYDCLGIGAKSITHVFDLNGSNETSGALL